MCWGVDLALLEWELVWRVGLTHDGRVLIVQSYHYELLCDDCATGVTDVAYGFTHMQSEAISLA